jgi:hypothetical protein
MRILMLFVALPAFAQISTSSNTVTTSNAIRGTLTTSGRPFMGTPVVGAPYSAQRVSERVQVGADGTRFAQSNTQEKLYRDSQGRTRTERALGPPMEQGPILVDIQDPVGGYGYTLDVQNKIAHRYRVNTPDVRRVTTPPAPGATAGSGGAFAVGAGVSGSMVSGVISATIVAPLNSAANAPVRPEFKSEDLGQQVIEGVVAKGHRSTQTWPTGSQGNDRPFSTTNETWMSDELKEIVLSKNVDPRSGENTVKLVNISRSEPSADLFFPPADYQVVDDAGSFQIHWEAPRK